MDSISKANSRWISLNFCMMIKFYEEKKLISCCLKGCNHIQPHIHTVRSLNWLKFKNELTNQRMMHDDLVLWIAWCFNSLKEKIWWCYFSFVDVRNIVDHLDRRTFILAAAHVFFATRVGGSIRGVLVFCDNSKMSAKTFSTSIAQKIKFSIKNFFSKCDQIRRKLRI